MPKIVVRGTRKGKGFASKGQKRATAKSKREKVRVLGPNRGGSPALTHSRIGVNTFTLQLHSEALGFPPGRPDLIYAESWVRAKPTRVVLSFFQAAKIAVSAFVALPPPRPPQSLALSPGP